MNSPHQVTKDFEKAVAEYTGAPYVVAVNSCTMALTLAVAWHLDQGPTGNALRKWEQRTPIEIPKRTYVSVPQAIIHAGGRPVFRDQEWIGGYQLKPLPVWDFARWFSSGMFNHITASEVNMRRDGSAFAKMICVSFHASKTLGIEQGGAILHDNPEADVWLRKARFDGRTEGVAPKDDKFDMVGFHCYLNPSTAAQGILRLHSLPRHNDPLPNDDYPKLDLIEAFQ